MIYSIGIDPDTSNCPIVVLEKRRGLLPVISRIHVERQRGSGRDKAVRMAQVLSPTMVWMDDSPPGEPSFAVATIEGQDVRYTGKTNMANPQSLCDLALVTGACINNCHPFVGAIYSPMPHEWKGTVPKHIKQKRILSKMGIEYRMMGGKKPYPVPVDYSPWKKACRINDGDWADITDAIGLALWGLEKYVRENPSAE